MEGGDVGAALLAGEGDGVGGGVGGVAGGFASGGLGDDGKHAAAVGFELAIGIFAGAAVEDLGGLRDLVEAADQVAGAGGGGVACGGGDEADAPAVFEVDEVGVQLAFGGGEDVRSEVALDHGQNGFGFRVAKAAVVFKDLRAIRGEHDAEVKEASIGQAVVDQSGDGGLDDVSFNLSKEGGRGELAGSDGAHAAGVGALVGVANAFVIAGGHEDLIGVVTNGDEDGDLRAGEALLNEEVARTEEAFFEDVGDEFLGFGLLGADGDAFTGGETVEFENDGEGGEGDSGFGGGGGDAEVGGGDGVALKELFGEDFGRLELGGSFAGAPAGDAGFGAEVGETAILDEPGFFTGDAEVDGVGLHPGDQGGEIWDGDAGGEGFDGVAAGAGEQFVGAGGSFQRGENGVLAAAFASNQYFHAGSCIAGRGGSARGIPGQSICWGESGDDSDKDGVQVEMCGGGGTLGTCED